MALGQAPLGLWWLALPALALVIARASRAPGPRASALAMGWAGVGYFAVALSWIVEPFLVEPAVHGWMAPFALLLMAFGMALFWALAGLLAGLLAGDRPGARAPDLRPRRALVLGLGLAAGEVLRSYVLTGFPWALIGHIALDTPLAQLSPWLGPLGLSLLLAGLAALAAAWPRAGGLAALLLLGLGWFAGQARLGALPPVAAYAQALAADPGRPIIRIAQPNAEQRLKWVPGMYEEFFNRLLRQSAAPPAATLAGRAPDLIVWPETAVPWLLNRPGDVLQMIAEAAQGVPVVLGIQRSAPAPANALGGGDLDEEYFNSLTVIGPDAQPGPVYDKHHLVPFGEYVPLGEVMARFGVTSAFAARAGAGYAAGPGPQLIDLGPRLGQALPLICYEAVFPQDVRASPARPDFLLQVTNDSWFGTLSGPWQHLAQARLRAIETGLPMIRAANTGVSAMIDPYGRVLGSLDLGAEGFLDLPLPPGLAPTPYWRWGDGPVIVLIVGILSGLAWLRRRKPH